MKDRKIALVTSLIFISLLTLLVVPMLIAVKSDLLSDIKDLKTDVIMYESMVEGLILTNKEQHNMLLECMEGDKK